MLAWARGALVLVECEFLNRTPQINTGKKIDYNLIATPPPPKKNETEAKPRLDE